MTRGGLLIVGLSQRRPEVYPWPVRVIFMVDEVEMWQVSEYFGFVCQYQTTNATHSSALVRRISERNLGAL
jgi:hypothetical protein